MFARKHSTGSAESGHDFINNYQRIGPTAPFTNDAQRARRPKAHPGGALDKRLDHDGSNLSGLGWAKLFQRLDSWDLDDRQVPPRRCLLEQRRGTQTRRARRIAMITAPKSDKLMPSRAPHSPVLVGNSQSNLDSC